MGTNKIWHDVSEDSLPNVGDIVCRLSGNSLICGKYRKNKFYGKVCDGYDNPLEKGDKWAYKDDLINLQEEPVSEDLEKAAVEAFKNIVDEDRNSFLEIFKAGAQWKEQQMMEKAIEWLNKNFNMPNDFEQHFRKAMSDNIKND